MEKLNLEEIKKEQLKNMKSSTNYTSGELIKEILGQDAYQKSSHDILSNEYNIKKTKIERNQLLIDSLESGNKNINIVLKLLEECKNEMHKRNFSSVDFFPTVNNISDNIQLNTDKLKKNNEHIESLKQENLSLKKEVEDLRNYLLKLDEEIKTLK